jgi:hypothetical protein
VPVTGAEQLALRVAVLVRAERERRGDLSLRALGAEAEVGWTTAHRLLRGQHVDLESLVRLARWAGHDLAVLPRPASGRAS